MVDKADLFDPTTITDDVLTRSNLVTKDFLKMKKEGDQLVFVYGTLKKGYWNHSLLEGSKYLGLATTVTHAYDMTESHPSGGFPVVFKYATSDDSTSAIKGEVYSVDATTMLELDYLESNGHMYNRIETWVYLRDQSYTTEKGMAFPSVKTWMYIGNPKFWQGRPQKLDIPTVKYGNLWVYDWSGK